MLVYVARLFALALAAFAFACAPANAKSASEQRYEHYVFGKTGTPTPRPVSGGLLLMGGGDRNVDALKWFFAKAGGGHIVVLSASYGREIGEEFFNEVGGVQSVEIFVFHARSQAFTPRILASLRKADGIFIAGGDQSRYVRFWRGTPVNEIIDAHVAAGRPLGGTSAGLAMLGEKLYGAMDDGSLKSPEALVAPLGAANTIEADFLHLATLKGVITDSHFKERDRLGRLFAFLAKGQQDRKGQPAMIGLGIDESAALAVEPDGTGRVHATAPDGYAWVVDGAGLMQVDGKGPLDAPRVKVTVADKNSRVHLPSGKVDGPVFERIYAARAGEIAVVPAWSLAIHGGAGVIERQTLSPEKEKAYRAGLNAALNAGSAVLSANGTALDAVAAAVRVLEDNPLFNAGRGAVFTAEGRNELDAAIMDGRTLKAGAVAGVTRTRHPVDLARAVMEKSPHVMLTGAGADSFSVLQGLEQVPPSWFRTEERWQQLLKWRESHQAVLDPTHLFGTVGAVALDGEGNLAAATSTGGMTGKRWNRVGDSPIIGAGTYASNGRCAVSATGSGEYFIRESAARQVCDRVAWKSESLGTAAQATIAAVGAIGGDGGLIAMGPDGKPAFAINDLGMYRGTVAAGMVPQTAIFADEALSR
ncbi:type 1 glutamine amidotransferase-like domain-containing protein [Novosphingobium sp. ERN07]|uniref:isoaspartyl peptidase/L-asparaginase n=1 Tax=Novosphingobium sp. ERN07 TaxID=2726187 RepID=UPI00145749C5|nr:isoaspartyl peptidase/L-asparaginase [Novosphingobium sp. ERN07]NLR70965.1 type 1 glutamine amidotransferase-like domain-containing protein [Novosphingobium sp. ERN07]